MNRIFEEIRRLREAGEEASAEEMSRELEEIMRRQQAGEASFEQTTRALEEILRRREAGAEAPPAPERRVLPRLPRRARPTPTPESPPEGPRAGVPAPEAGAEAPPAGNYPPLNEAQARERMTGSQEGLSRFENLLQRRLDEARRNIETANNIASSLEGELFGPEGTDEPTALMQLIEDMTRTASNALRHAEVCNERGFNSNRNGYFDLSARASSELGEMRTRLREVRDLMRPANAIQNGTVVTTESPLPDLGLLGISAPPIRTFYNIENLRAASERALSDARGAGVPANDPQYQGVEEARERANRVWDTLRESQEFRELPGRVTALRQRLELINQFLTNLEESFRENHSQAQRYMADAETALERCRREERREKGKDKAEGPPKAEGPLDLSGTWMEMKGDKPIKEWEIRIDEKGKITLIEPSKYVPGKVVEFLGSIEGNTITARHIIKDPDLVDPKIPKKVRETAIKEYIPTWDLDLKVSKDGTAIEGEKTGFKVTYDKKTQEVEKVFPHFERELVLKRKEVTKGPPSDRACIESLQNFNGAVVEQTVDALDLASTEEAVSRIQSEFNSHIRQGYDALIMAQNKAKVMRAAGSSEERARSTRRCEDYRTQAREWDGRAGSVMNEVDRAYDARIDIHQRMSRRYNAFERARQELEACLGQLRRTPNPTQAQRDLMDQAQHSLQGLDNLRPPELNEGRLREERQAIRRHMDEAREALSQDTRELNCHDRDAIQEPVEIPEELLTDEERERRLQEMGRAVGEAMRPVFEMMRIRGKLERGEPLTPEEEEMLRQWQPETGIPPEEQPDAGTRGGFSPEQQEEMRSMVRAWVEAEGRFREEVRRRDEAGEEISREEAQRLSQPMEVAARRLLEWGRRMEEAGMSREEIIRETRQEYEEAQRQERTELRLRGPAPLGEVRVREKGIPPRTHKGLEKGPGEETSDEGQRRELEEIMRRWRAGEELSPEDRVRAWREAVRQSSEAMQRQQVEERRALEEMRRRGQAREELTDEARQRREARETQKRELEEIIRRWQGGDELSLEEQEKLDTYRREQLTEETGNRISDLVRRHLLEERDSNGISELERRLAAEEFSLIGEEEIQRQLRQVGGEEYNRQHPEEIKAILRRAARGEDLSEGEVRELEFYRNTPGLRQRWPWLDRVISENRRGLGQSEEEILQFSYDSELGGLESFYMHIINDRRAGRRITNEAVLDRLLELRRGGFPNREDLPIGYGEQLEEGIDNYIQESREEIENLRRTLRFGAGSVEP